LACRHFRKHPDDSGVFSISIAAADLPLRLPLVDWQALSILRVDSSSGLPLEGRPHAGPGFPSAESARIDCITDLVSRGSVPQGLGAQGLANFSNEESSILLGRNVVALPGLWLVEDLHGESLMNWDLISGKQIPYGAISSVILIVTVLVVKKLLLRAVLRLDSQQPEVRRRWVVNIRNASLVALLLGLIMIWAEPLRTLAVSFIALAVAAVIATKELILCVSGSVVRATSKSYAVGDRIEIAGKRGDVVDQNLFTTTLLEIGPGQSSHQYTGRAIVIPNSLLLNTPLINETFTHDYVLHVFCIPLTSADDWQRSEQLLLEAAQIECGPFLEQARMYMKNIESQHGLDSPTVAPRVTLQIPEPGKINLLLRIPAPSRRKGRLEQAILRRYLSQASKGTVNESDTPFP